MRQGRLNWTLEFLSEGLKRGEGGEGGKKGMK
jgi:hypothetical protein